MKKLLVATLLASSLAACGSDGKAPLASASAAPSASAPAPPAAPTATEDASASATPAAPNPCEPLGLQGDGSMKSPCKLEGTPPITAKWTGQYKPDFDGEKPSFTVTSTLSVPVNWGNIAIYYYDKNGKQLEVTDKGRTLKKYWVSGGLLQIGAKETKEMTMGFTKDKAPEGTASIEVEIEGYGWTDRQPVTFFENPDLGHDERPKGGAPPKKDDKKDPKKDLKAGDKAAAPPTKK